MKSLREYLQEQAIDYNLKNIQSILKQNAAGARSLLDSLSKEERDDFIEQVNKTENYKQFLDSKKDRDLLVAAYIVSQKDKDYADKVGLEVENPETFEEIVKNDIISPTRKRANEEETKSPDVLKPDTEGAEGDKTADEPEDDAEGDKEPEGDEADVEPEGDEEKPKAGKESKEERKERIEKSVKRDVEKGAESAKRYNYKKTIDKLKETQKEALDKLEDLESKAENKKSVNKQKEVVQSKVDKLIKRVQRAEEGLVTNPELKAKQALTELETVTKNAVLKAQRSQLAGAAGRTAKKVGEVGGRVKRGVTGTAEKVAGSAAYKQGKEVARVAGKTAAEAGRVAGKKIKDVQQQIQSNARANFIAKQLNYGDARKWITAEDEKTKEQIYQKALKKSKETRQKKSAVAGSKSKSNVVKLAGQQQKARPSQQKTNQAMQKAKEGMTKKKKEELTGRGSPTAGGSPITKTG